MTALANATELIRLNLGSGPHELDGYINLDRKNGNEVYPLAHADGSVDEIRASHVLEHFSHLDFGTILADWVRALKPGGILKIAVPDFQIIAERYLRGDNLHVQAYVMGAHSDGDDFHGMILDRQCLAEGMKAAGLIDLRPWRDGAGDTSDNELSLNLQGRKPHPEERAAKCAAIMSMPRLAFTENMHCAIRSIVHLGIPFQRTIGVFWHKNLSNLMLRHLNDGTEYLITIDYDSVFEPEDVKALVRLMNKYPEADAICPVQMKRGSQTPLVSMKDAEGNAIRNVTHDEMTAADLLPIHTGHFGLTIVRVEALKKLPKPWMQFTPDASGDWSDECTDADIEFWLQMKRAGLKAFIAPHVVIGHMEQVVTWPSTEWKALHQHQSEYEKGRNKPEGCWS